jgi:hypothetical protein
VFLESELVRHVELEELARRRAIDDQVQNQGQDTLGDDCPDGDREEEDNQENEKAHTVPIGRTAPKFSPARRFQ